MLCTILYAAPYAEQRRRFLLCIVSRPEGYEGPNCLLCKQKSRALREASFAR